MKELIRRILKEETSADEKEIIQDIVNEFGFETAVKYVGGIENLIKIGYDGDLIKFSEDTITPIAYLSAEGMSLYLHVALVNELELKDYRYGSSIEKELGDFRFGGKNSMVGYRITTRLRPAILHDQPYYMVVGVSGDSGFGYSGISQRNILGKRFRQQIFKQIIDKYNLEPYMKVKTFY